MEACLVTHVHLVTEYRTGGGLAAVLQAEAEHQRRRSGKERKGKERKGKERKGKERKGKARFQFSRKPSSVNGNAELPN